MAIGISAVGLGVVDAILGGRIRLVGPISLIVTAVSLIAFVLAARRGNEQDWEKTGTTGTQATATMLHNLRVAPSRFFSPRVVLRQVELHFAERAGVVVLALVGGGGEGKTQVALKFAHDRLHDHYVTWWVRADSPETLREDLLQLARELHVTDIDDDEEQALKSLRDHLSAVGEWLIILDDASENPGVVREFVPTTGNGRLIVTSQFQGWEQIAHVLPVGVFTPAEASLFLEARLPDRAEPSDEAIALLSEALGYLPLALEQAASHISQSLHLTAEGYLALFKEREAVLLREHGPPGHERSVAATVTLTMDKIRAISPSAIELLEMLAYLDPAAIPLRLFQYRDEVEEIELGLDGLLNEGVDMWLDPQGVEKDLALLRDYSLVTFSAEEGAITVHRLTQSVVRHEISGEASRSRSRRLHDCLWSPFRNLVRGEPFDEQLCDALPPHVVAAARLSANDDASSAEIDREEQRGRWAELLVIVSRYVRSRKGSGLLEAAERAAELAGPLVDPDVRSAALKELGVTLQETGDSARAVAALRSALVVDEHHRGADDPRVAEALTPLALALWRLGDVPAARSTLERSRAILESTKDSDPRALGETLRALAMVELEEGAVSIALPHLERALEAHRRAAQGRGSWAIGESLRVLAVALREQGELALARQTLEEAHRVLEETPGRNQAEVGETLRALAVAAREQGDLHEAQDFGELALMHQEAAWGADHPAVAGAVSTLGMIYAAQGNLAKGKAFLERAVAAQKLAFGPEDMRLADTFRVLARVLVDNGEHTRARAMIETARDIHTARRGDGHWSVGADLRVLGRVLRVQGDLAAAEDVLVRGLEIHAVSVGTDHWRSAGVFHELGRVRRKLGDLTQAKKDLELALETYGRTFGGAHFRTARALLELSKVERDAGDLRAARSYLLHAIGIGALTLGVDHVSMSDCMLAAARVEALGSRQEKSQRFLEVAFGIEEAVGGSPGWRLDRVREVATRLGVRVGRPR